MRYLAVLVAVVVSAGSARPEAAGSGVDNSTQTLHDGSNQEGSVQTTDANNESVSCAFHMTPACMKSLAARFLDKLASDPHFQPLPGVIVSSDLSTKSSSDSLDIVVGHRAADFFRSLTLTVRPLQLELPFNASQVLDNVLTQVSGRKKGGANGVGLVALVMGGGMMAMMMAGLAAMAGKALMTSLTALMLAALSAMKGSHGGDKTSTYEIYAKPQHSSDHGW